MERNGTEEDDARGKLTGREEKVAEGDEAKVYGESEKKVPQ